jgi:hypothetical protein
VHDLLSLMLSDLMLVLKDKMFGNGEVITMHWRLYRNTKALWKGKVLVTNKNSQSDKGYNVCDVPNSGRQLIIWVI